MREAIPYELIEPSAADLADRMAKFEAVKRSAGSDLKVWGSSVLVRSLSERGLVDELVLMTYPVVLGTGKKLFGDGAEAAAFTLTDSVVTPDGVFLARYARSGEVRTGTVGASDTP